MPCNSLTNFEYEEPFEKTRTINFAAIWQKDILTLDGLEKGQLIQLGIVARIKVKADWPHLPAILFLIGNFAMDVTEIVCQIVVYNTSRFDKKIIL